MQVDDLTYRLEQIQERIAAAASRAGRDVSEVTLIAVTKTRSLEEIQAAYSLGLRDLGENRVAELLEKKATLELHDVRWHAIGHIQSRKARDLIGESDLIHSIDRLKLAQELSKRASAKKTVVQGLLQVNSSGEASKGGWRLTTLADQDAFIRDIEKILALPGLQINGLMTMAPFHLEAQATRPTFVTTRTMQQRLTTHFGSDAFPILSMGMSNDFEVAIEEGTTHVRIGTALFGPRHT